MTEYIAQIDMGTSEYDTDRLITHLAEYDPCLAANPDGTPYAILVVPAESMPEAFTRAYAASEAATGVAPAAVTMMSLREYRREMA